MKSLVSLTALALAALACSETTSPDRVADLEPVFGRSDPAPAPTPVCSNGNSCATWDDDVGIAAAGAYGISSIDVSTAPSGESFSGRHSQGPVLLALPNAGNSVRMRFKLYIVGAWEGEAKRKPPHIWELATQCGATGTPSPVIYASFSNKRGSAQSFPGNIGSKPHNGGHAGNSGLGRLQYKGSGLTAYFDSDHDVADSEYNIERTLTNSCAPGELLVVMRAHNLNGMSVNSWGIDNLSID